MQCRSEHANSKGRAQMTTATAATRSPPPPLDGLSKTVQLGDVNPQAVGRGGESKHLATDRGAPRTASYRIMSPHAGGSNPNVPEELKG